MRVDLKISMSLLVVGACHGDAPSKSSPPEVPAASTPRVQPSPGSIDGDAAIVQTLDAGAIAPPVEVAPAWRIRVAKPFVQLIAIIDRGHVALAREGSLDVEIAQRSGVRRAFRVATRGAIEGEGVVELIASPTEIVAAANGAIRVFDATTAKRIRDLLPDDSKRVITGLVWLRDGSVLASLTPDRGVDDTLINLHRWAADGTAGFVTSISTGQRWMFGGIDGAALSPDGATIATGMDQVNLIDAKTGESAGPPFGYQRESADSTATIRAITWEADGPLACSAPGFIGEALATIYLVRRDRPVVSFTAHPGAMERAAFLHGDRLVTAGHTDHHVTVRDVDGAPRCELTGVTGEIWALSTSQDGTLVAVADDQQLLVWDLVGCSR